MDIKVSEKKVKDNWIIIYPSAQCEYISYEVQFVI